MRLPEKSCQSEEDGFLSKTASTTIEIIPIPKILMILTRNWKNVCMIAKSY
jgi:hypothetical protein